MTIDDITGRLIEFYEYCKRQKIVRSTSSFASSIDLSRGGFAEITKGNNFVSLKTVMATLQKYPQLNKYWLIFGEGEMILLESATHEEIKPAVNSNFNQEINYLKQIIERDKELLRRDDDLINLLKEENEKLSQELSKLRGSGNRRLG